MPGQVSYLETYQFDGSFDDSVNNREQFLALDWNKAYDYCTRLVFAGRYPEAVRLCQAYCLDARTAQPRWRELSTATLGRVSIAMASDGLRQYFPDYVGRSCDLIVRISSNQCEMDIVKFDAHSTGLFRFYTLQLLIDMLAMRTPVRRSLVIAFNLSDQGGAHCAAMCSRDLSAPLFPDYDFLCSDGYAPIARDLAERWVPWSERRDVAFWRGVASGYYRSLYPADAPEADYFTRGWLARFGHDHRDSLDVGLTDVSTLENAAPPEFAEEMRNNYMAPRCDLKDFLNFKYTFDVDGWGSAFSGLFTKLLMGSVVFKIDSANGYRQWYYDRMKPYVHYIPCARNGDSILENISWCRAHPDLAEKISRNAREFALSLDFEAEIRHSVSTLESAAIVV